MFEVFLAGLNSLLEMADAKLMLRDELKHCVYLSPTDPIKARRTVPYMREMRCSEIMQCTSRESARVSDRHRKWSAPWFQGRALGRQSELPSCAVRGERHDADR